LLHSIRRPFKATINQYVYKINNNLYIKGKCEMRKLVKNLLVGIVLVFSVFATVGCNKEPKEVINQEAQEESKKYEEENKEIATLKLESWETDEINEVKAKEYFLKHFDTLHNFNYERADEYLANIKPLIIEDRYPIYERVVKEKWIPVKDVTEAKECNIDKIVKQEYTNNYFGYDIYYTVKVNDNGKEATSKVMAQILVIDKEFKVGSYFHVVKE